MDCNIDSLPVKLNWILMICDEKRSNDEKSN